MWTTPESVRTASRFVTPAGDAAQRMIHIMDAMPVVNPLTKDDWDLIRRCAQHDAENAYMVRLSQS